MSAGVRNWKRDCSESTPTESYADSGKELMAGGKLIDIDESVEQNNKMDIIL